MSETTTTDRTWTGHPTLIRAAKAARDYLTLRLAGQDAVSAEAVVLSGIATDYPQHGDFSSEASSYRFAVRMIRDVDYFLNGELRLAIAFHGR